MWLISSYYVFSLGFLYGGFDKPLALAAHRWFHWAADNEIPLVVAKKIWASDFTCFFGGWRISDITPLQSAFVNFFSAFISIDYLYQLLGICLQSACILGSIALLLAFKYPIKVAFGVSSLFATTGFFLMNSFYTWPKLLAVLFLLLLLANLFCVKKNPFVIGALAAFAFLAHSGSFFALIAIGLWFIIRCGRINVLATLFSFLLFIFPWLLYVKYVDPPGDRLAKWHLAGKIDEVQESFFVTLFRFYTENPLSFLLLNKLKNVLSLFCQQDVFNRLVNHSYPLSFKVWWDFQFVLLFFAVFPLIFFLLVFLFKLKALYPDYHYKRFIIPIFFILFISTVVTCMLMYGVVVDRDVATAHAFPILPHQTYFLASLIIIISALCLMYLPRFYFILALVLHFIFSVFPYFFPPCDFPGNSTLKTPNLLVLCVSSAGLIYFFFHIYKCFCITKKINFY